MHLVRKKLPKKDGGTYEYLHVYEARRRGKKVEKKFVTSLGRVDDLGDKQLVGIAEAVLRFVRREEGRSDEALAADDGRHFGDVKVLRTLWCSLGLDRVFRSLAKERRFEFDLESALFAMVAQRLCAPGSKLACVRWLEEDVFMPAAEGLDEDNLYDTLSWLESVKPEAETEIADRLRQRGLLESTAFFYDTTATWFEGRGPETLAAYGRPKGGQPRDRRLVLVGLVRTREGWPITHRVFPGNRADVSTVLEILKDLRDRFGITRFVFVGDRGMVSEEILEHLEAHGLSYVLAMRSRRTKEVRDDVLGRAGRFQKVRDNLDVKEVRVEDRRHIVCRNLESVERDRNRREDILSDLREKIGTKGVSVASRKAVTLQANRAFSRYLKVDRGRLVISQRKVRDDARYDGKWVIRTNIDGATSAELAETYKDLGRIEHDFRDLKSFIKLRPVHHRLEPRVRAHVFVCVLAKLLLTELDRRLGPSGTRPMTAKRALKVLKQVRVNRFQFGTEVRSARMRISDEVQGVLDALSLPASTLRLTSPT
jgi:transposase